MVTVVDDTELAWGHAVDGCFRMYHVGTLGHWFEGAPQITRGVANLKRDGERRRLNIEH